MSESVAAEHDYIGLSEFPTTAEATTLMADKTKTRENNNNNGLNFKATGLRLGLPGSESLERVDPRFLSLKSSCPVSGAKRVFSDAINGSNKWVLSSTTTGDVKDGKSMSFPKPAVRDFCKHSAVKEHINEEELEKDSYWSFPSS